MKKAEIIVTIGIVGFIVVNLLDRWLRIFPLPVFLVLVCICFGVMIYGFILGRNHKKKGG